MCTHRPSEPASGLGNVRIHGIAPGTCLDPEVTLVMLRAPRSHMRWQQRKHALTACEIYAFGVAREVFENQSRHVIMSENAASYIHSDYHRIFTFRNAVVKRWKGVFPDNSDLRHNNPVQQFLGRCQSTATRESCNCTPRRRLHPNNRTCRASNQSMEWRMCFDVNKPHVTLQKCYISHTHS